LGDSTTVTVGSSSFKSCDLEPNGQAVFDLGSSDARWRRVHTSGLRVYGEQIVAAQGMSAGDSRVTNVAAPTADADAATKMYVDDAISAASPSPASGGKKASKACKASEGEKASKACKASEGKKASKACRACKASEGKKASKACKDATVPTTWTGRPSQADPRGPIT
jgi:hypothetical protein